MPVTDNNTSQVLDECIHFTSSEKKVIIVPLTLWVGVLASDVNFHSMFGNHFVLCSMFVYRMSNDSSAILQLLLMV